MIDVICVVLVVKVALLAISVLGCAVLNDRIYAITTLWNRWDAPHYIDIARYGYTDIGERRYFIVFLPLYPFLIKLLSFIFDYEFSAMLVSNICSAAAAIYMFKIARLDLSERSALRSVIYFATFPTAYFMIAGYTEGSFLLLAISCMYYARTRRWLLSGFLGMLATATRITGLALIPALIAEFIAQMHEAHKRQARKENTRKKERQQATIKTANARAISAILMTPVGSLIYLMINHAVFGDVLAFMRFQREHWFKHPAPPWIGFINALSGMFWRNPSEIALVCIAEILFCVLGIACIIYAFTNTRISYAIYMLFSFIAFTSSNFWLSIPRYTLSLFPIFIIFASISEDNDLLHHAMIIVFVIFLSFFTLLFTQGRWAF